MKSSLETFYVKLQCLYLYPVFFVDFEIVRVDTHQHQNKKSHHTDQFTSNDVILRRGQEFFLDIYPKNTYGSSEQKFYMELWTGSKPREVERTLIKVQLSKYLEKRKWGMKHVGTDDGKIQLKVNIPSSCIVGKYNMRILTMRNEVLYKHDRSVIILFNPWSTGKLHLNIIKTAMKPAAFEANSC